MVTSTNNEVFWMKLNQIIKTDEVDENVNVNNKDTSMAPSDIYLVYRSLWTIQQIGLVFLLLTLNRYLPIGFEYWTANFPPNIYQFKVNNRNTRKKCEICSKLTIKTPKRRHWHRSGVFVVNFEHISHLF